MKINGVLLDTSFFIRFLNDTDPLFKNALEYYKYFLSKEIKMFISTISIAEYCVGGSITELPLRNLAILPFNLNHAIKTGEIAKIVFTKKGKLKLTERNIIPNDSKLFSQADVEKNIIYYLSSDTESIKIYTLLQDNGQKPEFNFINLNTPPNEYFGYLDL
jgi:predicted nucleic acid-binding protein